MMRIHEGQCGLCRHFGEHSGETPQLVQIRLRHEAPETLVEKCGLPANASIDLTVSPISGCAGFEPAPEPQA